MKTWIIAVALGIAFPAAGGSVAFAQAGSTGGTIGKQDKSVSGGEEQREPGSRQKGGQQEISPSMPAIINLIDHSGSGFSIMLRRTSGNVYEGTWNHGIVSQMTVRISQSSMTLDRRDISGTAMNLCHGRYTGTRSPGTSRASGDAAIVCGFGPWTSTWDASW
jgi:hypothetical protein